MSACATSSPDDTRWQDAALTDSLVKSSMENSVCCVSNACPNCPVVCLTVKPVGEPDAGDRHVRFDERGWETARCRMAQATAPILDSTKFSSSTNPYVAISSAPTFSSTASSSFKVVTTV